MNPKRLTPLLLASLSLLFSSVTQAQQVYKWTDASGQVHYGQKKPEDAGQVQALDIAPPPSGQSSADSAAEIARLNALSDQMARERQATEQARQEQTIRNLELEKQQLQKELLEQQLEQQQQQKNDDDNIITGYPPSYPYPYPPYPPKPPYPPPFHPCEPWPACYKPLPPPQPPTPPKPPPQTTPTPSFKPKSVGVSPTPQSTFRAGQPVVPGNKKQDD